MSGALKGSQSQIARCVVDDDLAVAVFALPVFCCDCHGVVGLPGLPVLLFVDIGVHPSPVPLDGFLSAVWNNEDGKCIKIWGWTFWVWVWSCLLDRQ